MGLMVFPETGSQAAGAENARAALFFLPARAGTPRGNAIMAGYAKMPV